MEEDYDDLSQLTIMNKPEEFKSLCRLQKLMMDITSERIQDTLLEILESGWINSKTTLKQFVHSCVLAAEYRPKQIETIAILLSDLMTHTNSKTKSEEPSCDNNNNNDNDDSDTTSQNIDDSNCDIQSQTPNYLHLLPHYLTTTIFRGLYYTKPFPKESSHLCFLFNCFKHGVSPIVEIIRQIEIFSKDYAKTARSLCWIFCYFAPEIEEADPAIFDKLRNILDQVSKKNNFPPVFRHFYNDYENIAKNSWTVFKTKRDQLYHKSTLVSRIRKDDIKFFKKLVTTPNFDIDKRILPTLYAQSSYLQNHPTLIQVAALFGAVKTFRFLMLHNADLSARDFHAMSLPQFAVAGGNIEIIRICQQNNLDFSGTLHVAALFHRIEILEWLHEEKFPDLTLTMLDRDGMNVLHAATQSCFFEGMKMCLQNNRYRYNAIQSRKNKKIKINLMPQRILANQNRRMEKNINLNQKNENENIDEDFIDDEDDEPFDIIRFNPSINEDSSILDDFVDINSRSFSGWSPIRMAVRYGHLDAVRFLLSRRNIDVNVVTRAGVAPIHFACKYGDLEICHLLLERNNVDVNIPTEEKMTPLHFAVLNGHVSIVRYLLSFKNIDVNAKDSEGNTPLHFAIRYDMSSSASLLIGDDRTDINMKMSDDHSPLYNSVKYDRYSIFSDLVRKRDDLQIENLIENENFPTSCLHKAAQDNHCKYISDLLEIRNVDPNVQDKNGLTPLHYACQNNSIECAQVLIRFPQTNVNALSFKDKIAPIHFASHNGNQEIIYLLCSRDDLDVNCRTSGNLTALHLACMNNKCQSVAALAIRDDVDFNAVNEKGATALHMAVTKGFFNVVDVLMSAPNINVDATLSNGKRAIDIARGKHFNDIARLITS